MLESEGHRHNVKIFATPSGMEKGSATDQRLRFVFVLTKHESLALPQIYATYYVLFYFVFSNLSFV